jgi:hypothetical protein
LWKSSSLEATPGSWPTAALNAPDVRWLDRTQLVPIVV